MRKLAFEKREDGSLNMNNPIIFEGDIVPEGLFLPDENKTYNTNGYEINLPEPETEGKTLEEKVAEHDEKIVTMEETINVIFGGV